MATIGTEKEVTKIIFVRTDGTAELLEGESLKKWQGKFESVAWSAFDRGEAGEDTFKDIKTVPVKVRIVKGC